jgi:hypothetical protein
MGLSVDFIGSIKPSSGPVREVVHMKQLLSCDVVTKPSAGGAFERILQSYADGEIGAAGLLIALPLSGRIFADALAGHRHLRLR